MDEIRCIRGEGIDGCPTCKGSGWTHIEACIGRHMKKSDREWGYCREECGGDECYKRCSTCWDAAERNFNRRRTMMVDIAMIDPERAAQIMGRQSDNPEALNGIEDLIPAYARIQVPLRDKAALKECAALLRTLSEELRILGDRHDISQTIVLFRAWREIKTANARMQDATRYGKQK